MYEIDKIEEVVDMINGTNVLVSCDERDMFPYAKEDVGRHFTAAIRNFFTVGTLVRRNGINGYIEFIGSSIDIIFVMRIHICIKYCIYQILCKVIFYFYYIAWTIQYTIVTVGSMHSMYV
jgi:hypothetical protein